MQQQKKKKEETHNGELERRRRGMLTRGEDKQKHVARWTETEREGGEVKGG